MKSRVYTLLAAICLSITIGSTATLASDRTARKTTSHVKVTLKIRVGQDRKAQSIVLVKMDPEVEDSEAIFELAKSTVKTWDFNEPGREIVFPVDLDLADEIPLAASKR